MLKKQEIYYYFIIKQKDNFGKNTQLRAWDKKNSEKSDNFTIDFG